MPASFQSDASRRVHFDTSVAESPYNGPTVTRKPVNDEYHLRMVFAEKKMWIKSALISQDESEMSDQERGEAQRHFQFKPETKAVHQNHIRFVDAPKTSPRKGVEVTQKSNVEDYYSRMVAIESKMWQEANSKEQAEAESLEEASHDVLRQVRFQDTISKPSINSTKTHKNNTKNRLYNRMVKLETKIWIEGGGNTQINADDKIED
ncbi:hypothetical protein BOTNAR_0161g00120 [Botryotinia narcissicola]|uniref:Uncharacterized protein n=1 Tax=Botryotinia narcissicola TaxID=278944 RepID=A0A4Z1ICZ1_9HELO|nr:hypothetical protein BOTNAR_0161g00120 [Botryotinia narcissicola]